jgi:hypothetical protein
MYGIEKNKWGFKESRDFSGLIPKINDIIGLVTGCPEEEVVVTPFDFENDGEPQLEVVDIYEIAIKDPGQGGDDSGSTSGDTSGSTSGDTSGSTSGDTSGSTSGDTEDHDFTPPTPTENTQEQQATADNIVNELTGTSGTAASKIVIPEGETLNNLTIPEDNQHFVYLSGQCADGATIANNSPKGMSISVENEEPVSITISGTSTGTTTLHGNFKDIYTTTPITLGTGDTVSGTITFAEDYDKNVSITADLKDGAKIQTLTSGNVTVNNRGEDVTSIEIYAPNANVTLNGLSDEVVATVADDTLYIQNGAHVNRLVMKKGNVKIYGFNVEDFIGEYVGEGTVEPMSWDVPTEATIAKMTGNSGTYNVIEDVTTGSTIAFGIFGGGQFRYYLNNHTLNFGSKNYSIFMRGNPTIDIYGPGKMVNEANGYLAWLSGEGCVLNIHGGEFEGSTHTLYAEKGTINIYDGVFKMANAATADRDANGNLKFLLNCFDANYAEGTAKINVYGGKFYEFNPAVSYSEPNGPISFVAEGYGVVESVEDGVKVYEVKPINEI